MPIPNKPLIVAGHICLDLIPAFEGKPVDTLADILKPGTLVKMGPAVMATGGAVANTGLALQKLGYPVRLLGSTGADAFGEAIRGILRGIDPALESSMMVEEGGSTSYTVVISPPGLDRLFLHHTGTNDTFEVADIPGNRLAGGAILHFGYPTLMRRVFQDGGKGLRQLFDRARAAGLATSLDMSMPDPESEAGRVDWRAFLREVLPATDVFLPSYDELSFMLDGRAGLDVDPDGKRLAEVSTWLLDAGTSVSVIKLGDQGLHLATARNGERLGWVDSLGGDPAVWTGRELHSSCFRANVAGTTGAGDCTIAGFLGALAEGNAPEDALHFATAVGAFNVEAPDATGGIRPRSEVLARLKRGWDHRDSILSLPGWVRTGHPGIRRGPHDSGSQS